MQERQADIQGARLVALDQQVQPQAYALETEVCTIGRAQTCQIVLQNGLVSRRHARIERTGARYILHDTNSANGTFVNGRRITESYLLKNGDRIGLGTATDVIEFHDPDPTFTPLETLHYEERAMVFVFCGKWLDLSKQQFRLLAHLYQHPGDICTRESCAEAIWGQDYDPGRDAHALDEMVRKLRYSLRQVKPDADLIKTRRGLGYELTL